MVAALWGVFVWKEFSGAGGKARIFLALMFLSYILALLRSHSPTRPARADPGPEALIRPPP
jgi:hypothetical protein